MNAQKQQFAPHSMTALLAGRPFAALSAAEKATYRQILERDAAEGAQRIVETLNKETANR